MLTLSHIEIDDSLIQLIDMMVRAFDDTKLQLAEKLNKSIRRLVQVRDPIRSGGHRFSLHSTVRVTIDTYR